MIVYRIRNRTTGEFFSAHGGFKRGPKTVWLTPAAAKNAWICASRSGKFSEQDVWECVPYQLVEVAA